MRVIMMRVLRQRPELLTTAAITHPHAPCANPPRSAACA
jgi:hypothetical protein